MNIAIVQGPFQPVPPVTGGSVEKLWFDLGREFRRRGHEVSHVSRQFADMPVEESIDGVRHRRVASFDLPRHRLLAKLMDLVYSLRCLKAIGNADIVVSNTFFLPLLLSLWPRRHRVVYVSVHRFPQGQMNMYRRSDRLQCVSTAVANAVHEQAPAVSRLVKVIPNYVSNWREPADVMANWSERRKEVLFVGRVHPEKGIDLLLRAYAAVAPALRDGWKLIVVGPHAPTHGGGGQVYLESLQSRAAALGLDVEWVGPIYDRALLDRIYARSRIFVYPSTAAKGEALPLAPLEAMSQGCAIVTSDLLCFKDYLRDGENGEAFALGDDDPAPRVAAALATLMSDDERQRRYSAAGAATVREFTLPVVAQALLDDFADLQRHKITQSGAGR